MGYGAAIGLALSAIGTGLSMASASKARSDMNKAVLSQLRKTDDLSKQSRPLFNESLDAVGKPKERAAQAEQVAKGFYKIPESDSPLPVDEAALEGKVGQARDASARARSYQDVLTEDWFRNQDTARRLGVNTGLAQSAAGTAPILAQLAGNKSAGLAGLGSLLSTAGGLAGIYGALKAPQPQTGSAVGGHSNSQTIKLN